MASRKREGQTAGTQGRHVNAQRAWCGSDAVAGGGGGDTVCVCGDGDHERGGVAGTTPAWSVDWSQVWWPGAMQLYEGVST